MRFYRLAVVDLVDLGVGDPADMAVAHFAFQTTLASSA